MIEGEIHNFIKVWSIATTLFCYIYKIGKVIPKGKVRVVALFPPIIIIFLLPVNLTSIHLGGSCSLFLAWLSTFKLLLFVFSKGPLSSNPPHNLLHFLLLASLPIKFQNDNNKKINLNKIKVVPRNWFELLVMAILTYYVFIPLNKYKENLHPLILKSLYSLHLYTGIEMFISMIHIIVRYLIQVELEEPFNKPYLSTSVQDFWGKRWNIMVSRILHPTVYEPMVKASSKVIGRKWAPLPAAVATFLVSGLMHEMMFYYIKREKATWQVWEPCWDSMCFFLIHGVCVALEIAYKKIFKPKHRLLPRFVSCILTTSFVVSTVLCLFAPALLRCIV
ncbi:acyl-CoA--sterol O-acyltransferase 1-like [Cicer arietinum]|uniref:Acyl-CoA--sterol O-acyltransferase 1-like n=1 Tax=Cicer arietinum TaxID=3827 RepID=A0A1S2YNZ6_CICAR|nr:acyl-CoA--sterol O-acyltransferase 1-like [Cicer arietinum]